MRLGSLCSGIGGLELGLERAGLGTTAWQCEYDPHASEVLARHWDVPNHGDVKSTDWSKVEPVDVICAGYPCQPFSTAGRRQGTDDDRHLWPFVRDAIRDVGPRLVVLENVRGHLSLGFGDVLGDLADLGFDAGWCLLRASDVGAPHQRARLFVAAYARDGGRRGREERDKPAVGGEHGLPTVRGEGVGQLAGVDGAAGDPDRPPSDPRAEGRGPRDRPGESGGAPADAEGAGRLGELRTRGRRPGSSDGAGPAAADAPSCVGPDQPGGDGRQRAMVGPEPGASDRDRRRRPAEGVHVMDGSAGVVWGPYRPAIERWEAIHGPAPAPTVDGRLSPDFVCWMQGFPEGWVDGLTRTAALRCLGNAVVPQVAERFGRMIAGDVGGGVVSPDVLLPTPIARPSGTSAESFLARKNRDGGARTTVTDLGMLVEQVLA